MTILADKNGNIDGTVLNIARLIESDVPIVSITRVNGFSFNESLKNLKKYVLLDYCEYNWDWDRSETHLFGKNTRSFGHIFGDAYNEFCDWVADNPPLVYFKRELLKKDFKDNIEPIEYPNWNEPFARVRRDEYNSRPIQVFFCWGHSHESRRILHGNIWINAPKKDYAVCDNIYYLKGFLEEESCPKKWVTINIPHYSRKSIGEILKINGMSKLSVSLPGAGIKCFRSTGESPVNSVVVMQHDDLAWRHEFEHGVSCIKVFKPQTIQDIRGETGCYEIPAINDALERNDLYEIYLGGVDVADKYLWKSYLREISESIKKYL